MQPSKGSASSLGPSASESRKRISSGSISVIVMAIDQERVDTPLEPLVIAARTAFETLTTFAFFYPAGLLAFVC